MYHIFSTAANSTEFIKFNEHGPKGINVFEKSVVINGGAGINRRHVQTPLGVHTTVSDEDYEWLKDDYHFKQKVKDGYITFRKQKVDPEVAAADMSTRKWVKSATGELVRGDAFPVSPQDFDGKPVTEGLTAITPKVNKTRAA